MMPRTLAPSNPSRGIDQLGVSDSLMMNANNNSPNSAVGGGSAMDDLLDRLQNATAATDVAGLGGGGGVTKTSFEHKQIPQDHNAHDLDRIHHGTNNADKASDILKKPPMGKGIGVGKKGGVDIKLIKQKDVSVTKGKSKTSTKKFGSRKRRTSSHSKGDDVIVLKKAETRTISALPQPRMKPKPRHHAWESDLQQQQSQSHSQDDADSEDPLPEVNTLAGETATMTKTTGSGSLSLPHQEQPQKHIGKRGIFTAHKNRKLQKELNKKNKAGVGTKKKQSMLSSVLRLDEEEVEEGFQDAKIRQGIEMARRSRNVQQSWKTPYEIDAPRTITVHRLQKPEQSDLPTNYLPEILVEKGTTGTAKGGGKSNNAESQSNTNDSIEFSTGSITGGNDNDSDTRSTEQRIWDGIEILLAEAFSENEGDTHSDSLRSHMSQLEDILPGQLLRAMGDSSVSSMLSITSPSKQQQHQKNNKDSIVFDNRDHSKALWETLKKADASRSGSMSIGTTSHSGGDLSQDEIGMARVTLNSFMDLLVPNQKEQEDGDDVVDMQGMTASASSRRNSSGGNMPRPSTADAEYALNNFMNALIGSLEDDLRKDPEKMSLDEQVQQIRKTQSTLTLFELFRWSLQVNVDATERTQYRNTHPHVHQHHPQQQRKKEKKGTTQKTNLPSSLLAPPPPPHATEGGGTPPSQEPHDHHQHLQPLPSPPPQSSTVPSWAANIVMSESSPLVSSSQSRSGDYGHGPLHGGRRGVAGRSQSPAPSSHLSDSVLLPSSFVDGVNEIMQMNEDTASKSRSGSGSGQLSRTNSGEMPELASISDESTSLPSYTGTGDSDSSSSSGTGTSTDGSLSFATASDEHPVPNEEQEKDGSRVGGVGAVPTGVVVDGDITTTRDRSNKKEEEKSEDDTPNDGPPAVGLVPSNSSSSKSSNMMLASNMIASNNDKATTLPNNKIKNATATTTARKMYKTTKLTPNDAALLSNDKKTTATGYTPYHTATTKRPQVMSAAGDVFSDDMSHSSLERYKAEFGPPQKAKQQQLKKKKGTKATGKNSKGSGNGSKKSSQPRSKSPTSNIKTVGRAGDVAVLPVQHRTVDVPHDLPESVDDDLTIDSTLKKDHDRDPTIVNRANIPRTKKNKYEKNKSEGRRSGFFGAWFGKSKRKVNSKDDGKKGKGKGKNDSSPSSRRLQYTSAVDNADGASGSFKNNKISKKKGGGTGGGAKTKTLMKSRRSITQSDKKRSVMTASTQPTSSRRSIPWKREPSDGVKCLMHEEERGYDEAPIIAR